MKKYILLLLFFTSFLQAQTLQNPTFGNTTTNTLKLKTPVTVTSVNFLTTAEIDGSLAKINPVNLPISTATINAINTATNGKQNYLDWKTPQDYGAVGDGIADDTGAIQNALNSNNNILLYGTYRVTATILIKDNQFIFSNNAKLTSTSNTLTILKADNKIRWKISGNLFINGSGKSDNIAVGLNIVGGYGYQVEGLNVIGISGRGILIDAGSINGTRGERGMFTSTFVKNCWVGIQYGYTAEYTTFSNLHVTGCGLGAYVLAGNITLNGGNITDNDNGLFLGGIYGNNNAHGIISALNINHNTGYNVHLENVQYGQTFIGCHIYGNATQNIEIVNSYGVLFDSCIIDGKIENTDVNTPKGYHLFSSCQMDPSTNVAGSKMHFKNNFTKDGIDFSENDFDWGLLGSKYMYAGAVGQRFAFSGSNTNVLYSGGSAGFAINNQDDTNQILTLSDSGVFKLPNLAGTGTRQVVADASGNLSATELITPYLKYVALLSQTGTSAPTATVLENTLGGSIVWTRSGVGSYTGTLAGVFTANKTIVLFTKTALGGAQHTSSAYSASTSTVVISNSSPGGFADIGGDNSTIEIRVYP